MKFFTLNPTFSGIGAMVLWSMTALMLALSGSLPPLQLVCASMLIAGATIFFEQLLTGKNLRERWLRPVGDYLFVTGGIGVYIFLYYYALKTAPVFEANIINYLWPLFLAVVLHRLQHEAFKPYQYIGFILGFCACALLFFERAETTMFEHFHIGYIAAFFAAISWALYSGLAKTRSYPTGFMAPVFLILGLVALVLHLAFEKTVWPENYIQWLAMLGLGVSRIAVLAWDYGIKHGNRMLLASMSYLIPIPSFIFLYIFGFGPASSMIVLSAVLVVCGIVITNWPDIYKMKRHFIK
jgi:drug/metabolite transporter (DMT)-like permease